ncbi:tRNA (uridine(34)/cytosine(34)/5-carboxymethylaminomethyluridine(34)-2'-O)-methyltransferase TrmL [Halioglobus japonicus]|uniref:tRNA (cytidine(34)-2'-O)-methyltransferase n=1 Tax=Halioglobus japonicus TaxID=930805 RepID=A0AAP8SMB8_9GAMM|nr:tRNA (uridine(34)/cytosine(34)/5-carboxymethylaminomethyluridine(34)-2'-O)-methyltransferase TrmL [Halioglobus japonicus]AQA17472.1 tRNA (uridine(34)/cytosine(34)/5-carboxymethylaminomethyluridine(34)-2'-O)-methyltransferase TrmL [Halioglobus japonicus]PLW85397.1 tRNA (uridine(34)/cytosine(34)/5-carboxymethylaminomethyluridine(34)-2'-O)-methyltransferase TrmL [Halioglobus japonicus]GHD15457.1 tRNA (cytidine(34)-2'-O)-methyltransferase [Halioglobus japonicus]
MLHIVLYQPEIPPNTGNIMRLCANTGCALHLIEPLGFDLDEKKLRRAGLDYREFAEVETYPQLDDFVAAYPDARLMGMTTKGSTAYHQVTYQTGDALLFGPETRGLPAEIRDALPAGQRIRIPMRENSRSLNLSNAAAIVTYEALRQLGFEELG